MPGLALALALALAAVAATAEAKRLSAGRPPAPATAQTAPSVHAAPRDAGAQTVAQSQVVPGTPAARSTTSPTSPLATPVATTAPAARAAPAAQAPAAPARPRSWMAGLAAGLGLTALFAALGLGAAWIQGLALAFTLLLVVAAAALAFRVVRRRWHPVPRFAYPGNVVAASSGYEPDQLAPEAAVEFDRSAVAPPGPVRGHLPRWDAPEGFDTPAFLEAAKRNFVLLQAAWDAADRPTLRSLMTDEMLANVEAQLVERGNTPNKTDVLMLQADLLGLEDLGAGYLASVEFSGMIREDVSAGATPFREIWSLTKPKDASSGWLVAGVQALQ